MTTFEERVLVRAYHLWEQNRDSDEVNNYFQALSEQQRLEEETDAMQRDYCPPSEVFNPNDDSDDEYSYTYSDTDGEEVDNNSSNLSDEPPMAPPPPSPNTEESSEDDNQVVIDPQESTEWHKYKGYL